MVNKGLMEIEQTATSVEEYQAMGSKRFAVTIPADPEIELAVDYDPS